MSTFQLFIFILSPYCRKLNNNLIGLTLVHVHCIHICIIHVHEHVLQAEQNHSQIMISANTIIYTSAYLKKYHKLTNKVILLDQMLSYIHVYIKNKFSFRQFLPFSAEQYVVFKIKP